MFVPRTTLFERKFSEHDELVFRHTPIYQQLNGNFEANETTETC